MKNPTRMRTTHPNESFNIQAWRRTPKHLLVTKSVSTAVLEYNKGTNELPVVFNMLDIRDGYYFALHATSSSRKRRMDASRHAMKPQRRRDWAENCSNQDRHMSMLPRREFCMKQEASIVRNVLFIYITSLYYIFSHLLYDNCSSATNI